MDSPGRWLYIAPVSGVNLTNSVNNEFNLKRSLLVDKEKLPRIRKRLGLKYTVSKLKKKDSYRDFFDLSNTYAITWFSGPPRQAKIECRRIIKDELALLALSQLGFRKRRFGAHLILQVEDQISHVEELINDLDSDRVILSGHLEGTIENLRLDDNWKIFQDELFFTTLLKIINGKVNISKAWKSDIERAAILVGQSLCSSDLPHSFLWNIIALETLFKFQHDKFYDEFPKRAEAFLGWVGFWKTESYFERIRDLYAKRCTLVHEGKRDQILIEDLLFSDDLVFNLFLNLIQNIHLFPTKESVVEFSDKVQAEFILGVKPKVRPKNLTFFAPTYTEKDLENI